MRMRRWGLVFFLLVGSSLAGVPARDGSPGVGDFFPRYLLPALETGDPLSISAYRGKKIILHQFASW